MKTIKIFALSILFIGFASCSSDDDVSNPQQEVKSQLVTNLKAVQSADYTTDPPTIIGDYVKFSFEKGDITTGDDWDIAFRGSTILVNGGEATTADQPERTGDGGAYITTGTLESITKVDVDALKKDSKESGLAIPTGSGSGWYNYNPTNHLIMPIAGKVIVVKTHKGKYAKMEILNYYENSKPNEDLSNSQYYTFNYVFQPNSGVKSL